VKVSSAVLDTLIGVLVGGMLTTASTVIMQRRTARTVTRSEIYTDLIKNARANSTADVSSQRVSDSSTNIRRRAILLSRAEARAAIRAERLLKLAQETLHIERETGRPKTVENESILRDYNDQLDKLDRLISRHLRWPG
jgi:hypothetical protein